MSSAPVSDPRTTAARRGSPLEITESILPVSEMGAEPFATLEQDVRKLMRELGEARFAVEDTRLQQREHMRSMLLGLLDAVDAFDRVLASIDSKPEEVTSQMRLWVINFRTARLLLDRVLTDEGLTRIVPHVGEGFDPYRHRVSGTLADPERPEGAIVEITVPGWLWQGALLRKSAVVVVHNGDDQLSGESPN